MVHERDCPDPKELLGVHKVCPCPWCLDTGYINADTEEIDCDCGAQLSPDDERVKECELATRIGYLHNGIFHSYRD